VEVLKKGKSEGFSDFFTDSEEEEPATVLAQLPHRFGLSHFSREEKVRFSFSLFGVEKAHGLTGLERFNRPANMWVHDLAFGLTFMKSRMPSLTKGTGSANLADSQQKDIIM
tara:strand:+ start:5163 stop:5498 length:336 start_codon:yes stop_codon:yes gene_type:complete